MLALQLPDLEDVAWTDGVHSGLGCRPDSWGCCVYVHIDSSHCSISSGLMNFIGSSSAIIASNNLNRCSESINASFSRHPATMCATDFKVMSGTHQVHLSIHSSYCSSTTVIVVIVHLFAIGWWSSNLMIQALAHPLYHWMQSILSFSPSCVVPHRYQEQGFDSPTSP